MNDHPALELSQYLDGALSKEGARSVEAHLRDCAECSERARKERALRRGLLVLACPGADLLGRYIDGSLDGPLQTGVKAHVARCAECAEAIDWTREAAASLESGELPKASGRRRRVGMPRPRRSPILQLAIPLAAAAAVIIAVLVIVREPSKPEGGDVADHHEKPVPRAPETSPAPPPSPRKPEGEKPAPPPEEQPPPPPENPPAPPAPPEMPMPPVAEAPTTPPPAPPESERPDQPPAPPPVPGTVAIANVSGDLRVGPSRDKATKLTGSANLSPRDLVFASAAPGSFELGQGAIHLASMTDARVESSDASHAPRLVLEKGETMSESNVELACHGASARPDGAFAQILLRAAPKGASVCVIAGKAVFSSAGGEVSLAAGEGSEVESDAAPTRPHKTEPSPWVAAARADRIASLGLDYPRGFLAQEAARALALQVKSGTKDRALALHAIEAARAADERLARVVEAVAGPAADAAFDQVVTQADALTAPEAALAVLARSRRLPAQKDALSRTFAALAKTLEKATPAELDALAQDADALLVLKPVERAGAHPRLRERVAEAPGRKGLEADLDWLARGTLAGATLDDADVRWKRADGELNKDAVVPANRLSPQSLLAIDRAQAAAGKPGDDERRFFKALEHLAAAGAKPCAGKNAAVTLLVLSREAHVLCGRTPAPPAASISILPRRDGRLEVTFVIDSPRHPRSVVLGGSWWEGWDKDKPAMTRRPDGVFVETVVLPRGRYVYKLHLENNLWETDARNPLYESDNKGGNNSVLNVE